VYAFSDRFLSVPATRREIPSRRPTNPATQAYNTATLFIGLATTVNDDMLGTST